MNYSKFIKSEKTQLFSCSPFSIFKRAFIPSKTLLKSKVKILIASSSIAAAFSGVFFNIHSNNNASIAHFAEREIIKLDALPIVLNPIVKFGFALDTFNVIQDRVKQNDVFTSLMMKRGLTYMQADSLSKVIKPSFDFDKIQDGKPYLVLSRDPRTGYDFFIFEPDAKRYIVVDLKAKTIVEHKRNIIVKELEASGKVEDNLWDSMVDNGFSYTLTEMVENALKYQFDLRKFKENDEYKLIWEEEFVDGASVGVKCLKAAYFKQKNEKPIYAIYYDNGNEKGWYSKDGLPMKDAFLKAPVKYSRITSGFSKNRFHPILGYNRPHFGTDYGAPYGTPIFSVADGVIEEARHGGGNGNYVKIKHLKPYETQYLHMSRFAKGIKAGTKVNQGDVIGYVGTTGLSTGPHVCFRFWKNGVQVNHLNEKLPGISSFSTEDKNKFRQRCDELMARIDKIPFLTPAALEKQRKGNPTAIGKP